MHHIVLAMLLSMTLLLTNVVVVSAQTTPAPSPGPTNPIQPNPQSQPGATIVINPTTDECRRGWDASMRWTQDQFREFCTTLGASK